TIKDTHNLALTFSYSGTQLSKVQEPNGFTYTFNYSGGALATVVFPTNPVFTFLQDASANVTGIVDPDLGLRTFSYDSNHLLTRATFGPRVGSFSYDAASGTASQAALGATGIWNLTPRLAQGLVTATAQNATADVAVVTDPYSYATTYTLDSQGRPTQ